jgi:2-C-methyl-D-erythritol 4-phosphate cytidylyltransferase
MNVAIILAAGLGSRFQKTELKQFHELDAKPLFVHTLKVFDSSSDIDRIILVMHNDYITKSRQMLQKESFRKPIDVVAGGDTRQESSHIALRKLADEQIDIVVIHDAVRPFVTHDIISRCIKEAREFGASDVVVPATDTIVQAVDGFIKDIPDRNNMYYGQTPQAFRFKLILSAHEKAIRDNVTNSTDDATLVLRMGEKVRIVNGSYDNIKLTTSHDLRMFESIFRDKSRQ